MFHIIQQGRLHLAGKSRRRGSMGAFTKLCSDSVVTSLQNSANVSSVLVIFNVLMIMTARDKPSAAESDFICRHAHARTHTHTYTLKLTLCWSRLRPNTNPKKSSNCCMCTCTPRIRAFVSVTVQLSNDQSHNAWSTLSFEMILAMASTRTIHLVGHKRLAIAVVLQKTSYLIQLCVVFGEYLTSLLIS